tara:strand:+ start:83 stop:421 length:339 start_codon:yes stop_codon:yes gene_type:complete
MENEPLKNFPVLTKNQLLEANNWAIKMDYNKALEPKPLKKYLKSLDKDTRFPIVFAMIHEHRKGEKVTPHIRCEIVLNVNGDKALIDIDQDLFNSLPSVPAPQLEDSSNAMH